MHHGVKDQKLGVRQYQNSDDTRTTLGKAINNQKPIEFNPEIDIPYMYKNGMISREEY